MTSRLPLDPVAEAHRHWVEHGWDSAADGMAAVTSVMRAQQILLARADAVLRPLGLTFARYEALMLLVFSSSGELPMKVVGSRLQVHPTSVTNTISRLERQELVVRRPNPLDGRGILAEITPAGRDVAGRATADLMAADFGLGGYGEDQLEEMFGMLRGLRVMAGDFQEDDGDVQDEGAAAARPGQPAEMGDACQVLPPSAVMNTSPRPDSAGTATP